LERIRPPAFGGTRTYDHSQQQQQIGKKMATHSVFGSPEYTKLRGEVDEAIQTLVEDGLLIDSGEKRWSERTRQHEIAWMLKPTLH
jgi:hypothetical protein